MTYVLHCVSLQVGTKALSCYDECLNAISDTKRAYIMGPGVS